MNIHGQKKVIFFKIFVVALLLLKTTNFNCNAILNVKRDESFEMVQTLDNHVAYSAGEENGIHKFGGTEDETWTIVQKRGNQFVVNDQPFYVNGFNTYWLMFFASDQSSRGKVGEIFNQASSVGLTVCRTWAFNDGKIRALQKSPSVYDEEVFKALDFVVNEAKKYKIRMILSLVNNWDDYGGKAQYVKWGKDVGLNLTSSDDFFTHPTIKGFYKSHVKAVLNRVNTFTNITYKDDPAIFAWELMNEPRCYSDPSGDKLQAWIEEMAFNVKRIDRKHLVEIGLEGFYGPSTPDKVQFNPNIQNTTYYKYTGTDFIRNHQVLGVDFASVHIYPDGWISNTTSDSLIQFASSWVEAHIKDAENLLGMPVLFSEFGISSKDQGYTLSYRDTFMATVYNTILNSTARGGSGGGSLFWQLLLEGMDDWDDGLGIVLSKSLSTAKIISLQSKRLKMFSSLCTWKCRWGCKKKTLYFDKPQP